MCRLDADHIFSSFSAVDWEGPDAIEESRYSTSSHAPGRGPTPHSESEREDPPEAIEESDNAGSEDEYVADTFKPPSVAAKKVRQVLRNFNCG